LIKGNKEQLYEGGVRGVGFVNSPLVRNPGTESSELIFITDWFATLLSLGQRIE
jgi:arylsulfatase B